MPSLADLMAGAGLQRDSTGVRPQVQDAWGRSPSDPNYGQPPGPGETVSKPAGTPAPTSDLSGNPLSGGAPTSGATMPGQDQTLANVETNYWAPDREAVLQQMRAGNQRSATAASGWEPSGMNQMPTAIPGTSQAGGGSLRWDAGLTPLAQLAQQVMAQPGHGPANYRGGTGYGTPWAPQRGPARGGGGGGGGQYETDPSTGYYFPGNRIMPDGSAWIIGISAAGSRQVAPPGSFDPRSGSGSYNPPRPTGGAPGGGGRMVLLRAPDGTTQAVPAAQATHYQARGAQLVG